MIHAGLKIEMLKSNAVRALSNYLLYQSAQKDSQLQEAMNSNKTKEKSRKEEDDDGKRR